MQDVFCHLQAERVFTSSLLVQEKKRTLEELSDPLPAAEIDLVKIRAATCLARLVEPDRDMIKVYDQTIEFGTHQDTPHGKLCPVELFHLNSKLRERLTLLRCQTCAVKRKMRVCNHFLDSFCAASFNQNVRIEVDRNLI
jgi:hypothetical protein